VPVEQLEQLQASPLLISEAPRRGRFRLAAGVAGILIAFVGLTYMPDRGWWWSLTGSALIVAAAHLAWPADALRRLGLRYDRSSMLVCALLLLTCAVGSYVMIRFIISRSEFSFEPFWRQRRWGLQLLHTVGQTLNEEMVIGALLLAAVRRTLPRASVSFIAVIVAAAFSVMHFVFYHWVLSNTYNYGTLELTVVATLWMVGIVRNVLIVRSGHIAYAWALHFGFNVHAFSGWVRDANRNCLNEPAMFNVLLGHPAALAVTATLAVLTFLLVPQRQRDGSPS
jgi:hypothetical protein